MENHNSLNSTPLDLPLFWLDNIFKPSVIVNYDQPKTARKKLKLHLLTEVCGQKRESGYMKIARKDNETKI